MCMAVKRPPRLTWKRGNLGERMTARSYGGLPVPEPEQGTAPDHDGPQDDEEMVLVEEGCE